MDTSLDFSMSQSGAMDFPSVNTPGGKGKGQPLSVGAAIEARHGGGRKWFPGKISAASDDGTFDIDYADGDKETAVRAPASDSARAKGSRKSRARRR